MEEEQIINAVNMAIESHEQMFMRFLERLKEGGSLDAYHRARAEADGAFSALFETGCFIPGAAGDGVRQVVLAARGRCDEADGNYWRGLAAGVMAS